MKFAVGAFAGAAGEAGREDGTIPGGSDPTTISAERR